MNRRAVTISIVGLAVALSAAGCAAGGDAADSPLVGDWELVSGTVGDEPLLLVPDHRITFNSDASTFGGTAACNHYGGVVTTEAQTLSVDEIFVTEMACEPEVMASEQAYLTALPLVNTASRDGEELLLSGDNTELVFVAVAPVDEQALVGTGWILETLIDGETATSAMGEDLAAEFREDGTLTAQTGCRTLTGTYLITGDEIQTPELSADGECTPDLERQDGHVVGVFEGGFTADIDGGRLTLTVAGDEGLVYRAR